MMMRELLEEKTALAWAGCRKGNSTFFVPRESTEDEKLSENLPSGASAERHSFLQYAMIHFRDEPPIRDDSNVIYSGSMRGTIRILEYLTGKRLKKGHVSDWTWKFLTDKVKYSPFPIMTSLLKLDSEYLTRLAVDSFTAIMRYMGDLPLGLLQKDVECVYAILVICHHHLPLRDEVYCQLMKQTTNNKSLNPESRIRGWRLITFLTAFFKCSDSLMPYLSKYLEITAEDDRRLEKATAEVCIAHLNQTVKHGGRRNVPSEEEVKDVTDGKLSRKQMFYLPGSVQLALPASSSTVVEDVIRTVCEKMGIVKEPEFKEFSLYCIVEGEQYTMPLESDEYIFDLVAELERNENTYYLVFCRSVWNFELRLDSALYIDIIFHQVVPDYVEGFLMIQPHHPDVSQEAMTELLWIASLLHRANEIDSKPSNSDLMNLLPKTTLKCYTENRDEWMKHMIKIWEEMIPLNATEAKAQFLEIIQKWPLFGSCFFSIKMIESDVEEDHILAINKKGANVLHMQTHETLWRFSFAAIHAPYHVVEKQGITYADVVFGDHNVMKTIRLQVDHAHEVTRLIRQYELIENMKEKETESTNLGYPAVMIKI